MSEDSTCRTNPYVVYRLHLIHSFIDINGMFVFFSVLVADAVAAANRMTVVRHYTRHDIANTTDTDTKRIHETGIQLRGSIDIALPYLRIPYSHYEGRSGEKRLDRRSKDL